MSTAADIPFRPPIVVRRVAVDWLNLLYDCEPPEWARIASSDEIVLRTPGESISLVRKGPADASASIATFDSPAGVWVRFNAPSTACRAKGLYHATLSAQGMLCSSARDGLSAVAAVHRAFCAEVYPGVQDIDQHVQPGKLDVAVDIEIGGDVDAASKWIEREVFRSGWSDAWGKQFATRARAKTQTMFAKVCGRFESGRTGYYGRDPRCMVYEKDKNAHPTDKNGRDLPLVREQWRAAGWDGQSRVIRVETRVSRDWLADNDIADSQQRVLRLAGTDGMPFSEFSEYIPSIARSLLRRFRMTDRHDKATRVHRRDTSPLWLQAATAVDTWDRQLAAAHGVAIEDWGASSVMSRVREFSRVRAQKHVEHSLADLHAYDMNDRPESSIEDTAITVATKILANESIVPRVDLESRSRRLSKKLNLRRSAWGIDGKPIELAAPVTLMPAEQQERDAVLERLTVALVETGDEETSRTLDRLIRAIERGEHRRD